MGLEFPKMNFIHFKQADNSPLCILLFFSVSQYYINMHFSLFQQIRNFTLCFFSLSQLSWNSLNAFYSFQLAKNTLLCIFYSFKQYHNLLLSIFLFFNRPGIHHYVFYSLSIGRVFEAEALLPRTPQPIQRRPGPSLLSTSFPSPGHLCPFPAGHPQVGGAFRLSCHTLVDTPHTDGRTDHHWAYIRIAQ